MRQSKLKAGIKPPSRAGLTPWNFGNGRDRLVCPKCGGTKPGKKAEFCRGCTERTAWNKGMELPHLRGEKSPHWKGGVTPVYYMVRNSFKSRQWRSDVFTRDNFTCVECGDHRGGNLNADHIKPFAVILDEYNIKTFDEAMECEELWNINNGRTLCVPCHKKTDTYGGKVKNYKKLYENFYR